MSKDDVALLKDSRYIDFVKRYCFDLPRFAKEVCGLDLTWQQVEVCENVHIPGSRTTISSGHGCFGAGTKIMLSDGNIRNVEDIVVGDKLMGDDGTIRNVLELYRGKEKLYRFNYSDGSSHVFNESHILCLVATNSKGKRKTGDKITVTVREWLTWGEDKKRCHCIYRSPIKKFHNKNKEQELTIDPYILGVWLGDGNSRGSKIYTEDNEIKQSLVKFCNENNYTLKNIGKSGNAEDLYIGLSKFIKRKDSFNSKLRALNLLNNKHIPTHYLYSDLESRKQILAGLIDTDGSLSKHSFDFVQKNKLLAEQVLFLARSIGCHATIKETEKKCYNNGKIGTYYRVTIGRNIDLIPTRVKRKQAFNLPKQRTNLHFSIKSVEPLGIGNYYGFELDGNHKFLGGDFSVLHNTGKTASFGVIALWHLVCFYGSVTAIIAPNINQVRKQVFKEISTSLRRMKSGDFKWVADNVELLGQECYIKGAQAYWHVLAKTAPKGEPENLAGLHADHLLIIVDEASGVEDTHFGVLTGALTHRDNRMMLASQPTRNVGFFYDTHHALSVEFGGSWTTFRLNSEESPIVSEEFILEKKKQYSPEQYAIKVRGEFPNKSDGFLLGRSEIDAVMGFNPIQENEEWGYILAIDVGGGDFRDDSVLTVARVTGFGMFGDGARKVYIDEIPILSDRMDTVRFARAAYNKITSYDNATTAVDFGGMGGAFIHNLNDLGTPNLVKVKWGNPCFRKEYRDMFFNLRAQAIVSMARAIQEKRFGISKKVADRYGSRIITELTRIPYGYDNKARYQIMPKEDMRSKGIPSPDIADSFAFLFMEGVDYIVCERKDKEMEITGIMKNQLEKAFDGIDGFFDK